ncbi:hypothetical protein ACOBV9_22355 (plasmid) [Pseudoalteromonas espejiana]
MSTDDKDDCIKWLVQNLKLNINHKTIQRHLTAINRDRLSAPFQKLAKYGYLNGDYSILDYRCGLADDATELEAHGLNINTWDQYTGQTEINKRVILLIWALYLM